MCHGVVRHETIFVIDDISTFGIRRYDNVEIDEVGTAIFRDDQGGFTGCIIAEYIFFSLEEALLFANRTKKMMLLKMHRKIAMLHREMCRLEQSEFMVINGGEK